MIILHKAKKASNPSVRTSAFTFCFRGRSTELYFYNMCVLTDIIQRHIYESVSFQTASLPACCSLTSPPARAHADELVLPALSGTISVFSKDDIITVPISQLLLWDVFHIRVMSS